jgi:hypothetical protein
MSASERAPALTMALLTPDRFATIARTVACVAAQDVVSTIELLILAPNPDAILIDPAAVRDFHSVRVIPVVFGEGSGAARATAVREARAPVIAFGEDHCFPDHGWARALLNAHRGPWAAVGPAVTNANPTTLVSWADLLMGYGPWLAPGRSEERDHLPGHNTSYKREALLSLGDELPSLMEAETPLQWRLREQGKGLYQEATARVAHTNFARWGTWLLVSYHAGRVFAATRALPWSGRRRVAFAIATPLVPLVRMRRHLLQAVRAGWSPWLVARVVPTLLVGLLVDAAGQGVGCLSGAGRSRAVLVDWEFRRNEPRTRHPAPAK